MRFKLGMLIVGSMLASIGLGQDINRASEWHIKRPEQTEAQVTQEMTFNGTTAPVGQDPTVLDRYGNPTSQRLRQEEVSIKPGRDSAGIRHGSDGIRHGSDGIVRSQFSVANTVVQSEDQTERSPLIAGGVFLLIGLAFVIAFRLATNKIKVPAQL